MKILICKTFGLGNAVMAVPMVKAIRIANPTAQIDVMVGSTSDDRGSSDVFVHLQKSKIIDKIIWNMDYSGTRYDVAVCAIPYDGRWTNGTHFLADRTLDCRTRPDPSTTGLVSWKKHEVKYQMENAYLLGYKGDTPTLEFLSRGNRDFYLGVGYKKDFCYSLFHPSSQGFY